MLLSLRIGVSSVQSKMHVEDLHLLLQLVLILIGFGLVRLVKRRASKYFVVDASFDAAAVVEDREKRRGRMIAALFAGGGGSNDCAVCGNLGRQRCSGCKAVRYCSINCQLKHWKAEHKLKCEEFALNSRKNLVSCVGSTTLPQIKKGNVASSNKSCAEDRAPLELITPSALRNKKVVNMPLEQEGDTATKATRPSTSTLINGPLSLVPVTTTEESSNSKDSSFICEICDEPKSQKESFNIKGCSHYFCSECMVKYVASKIEENITLIRCPEPGCQGVLEPQFCRSILPLEVFDRWADALCEAFILGIQRYYCPYKDCSAPLVYDEGMVIKESECPHCHRLFCAQCKVPWHPGIECEEYQKLKESERGREDLMVMELAKERKWQRCPMCRFYVERIDGCLYMKCRCGFAFCYNCAARVTEHYCNNCKR